ncbi:hypothetical protein QFZ20_004063 [Flavobacterium sp. W4I14]|nr:hypothetical protein [Flavobacterium sp. W4I14]
MSGMTKDLVYESVKANINESIVINVIHLL